jgi:NAD(P)-dependent dehydrogenase (short-subunit alcohol dehydrogenase family)
MSLAGKVVVVTGSTLGIGRAIAEAAGRAGATVVVNGRSAEGVERAIIELSARGISASGLVANAGHYEEIELLRDHALEAHGRIDVWVSNAGLSNGYRFLDDETAPEIHDLITVNVIGALYGAKALLPLFREHGGYLMNVAGRGWKGDATPYTTAYGASKAAVASLTRSLAAENREHANVSINAFVPGMVDTDFYHAEMPVSPRLEPTRHQVHLALEAFGTPLGEVGERCVALIAEEPGRTTGKIFPMLGGMRLVRGGAKMAWWGMTGRMRARE